MSPPDIAVSPVVARRNLAAGWLRQARDQGGMMLLVDGLAGMGKTRLLRDLAGDAQDVASWTAMFVYADEIEQGEPYSFIERLIAGGLAPDWDFAPDATTRPIPVARECVRRLTQASGAGGRVIVIDDAQWVDAESQQVLRYLIPRITRRHVLIALGVRSPHADGSFGEVLTQLAAANSSDVVHHVEPLTVNEIRALVLGRFGTGISTGTAERLRNESGGSFLRLDGILMQLTPNEGSRLHMAYDIPIRGSSPFDNPLLHQFYGLSEPARGTAELVCLAGHELSRRDLTEAARLLGEPLQLDEAIAAGVLSESGFGSTIVARHSLVAHAVRGTATKARVQEVSRALAAVTSGYRSVRHALRGAERWDEDLSKQVAFYVDEAIEQGGFGNADEILRTALGIAEGEARQELLITLAMVHLRAKTGWQVMDLLPEFEQLPMSLLREFIVVVVSGHRVDEEFPRERAMNVLFSTSTDPDDRTVIAFLAFLAVLLTMRAPDPSEVPQLIEFTKALFEQAPADIEELSDPRLAWMVAPHEYLVLLDCYQMVHNQRQFDLDEVRSALPDLIRRIDEMPEGPITVDALVAVAGALVTLGDLEQARVLAQRSVDLMDRVSQPWATGTVRLILADCLVLLGELSDARSLIELCEEIFFDVVDVETRPAIAALHAMVAAMTGAESPTRHLDQARVQHEFNWESYGTDLAVLAECEVARSRGDAAGVLAASAGPRVEQISNTRLGFLTYRVHALIDRGELDAAAALIEDLAGWRGTRWQEYWGTLDWLRARLAQAQGDTEQTRRHYASAVENKTYPLPTGLTLADFGMFLIGQGEYAEGRRTVLAAIALLERIGARGYVPRVREALDSAGDRAQAELPPMFTELTGREREIAGHLADGLSNKQIADLLVISVATVRFHVSNVLHKLQLSSRAEVARALRQSGARDG